MQTNTCNLAGFFCMCVWLFWTQDTIECVWHRARLNWSFTPAGLALHFLDGELEQRYINTHHVTAPTVRDDKLLVDECVSAWVFLSHNSRDNVSRAAQHIPTGTATLLADYDNPYNREQNDLVSLQTAKANKQNKTKQNTTSCSSFIISSKR